jgi:hypothetical protein
MHRLTMCNDRQWPCAQKPHGREIRRLQNVRVDTSVTAASKFQDIALEDSGHVG